MIVGEASIALHVLDRCLLRGQQVLGIVAGSAAFHRHVTHHHPEIPCLPPGRANWVEWVEMLGPWDLLVSALNLKRIPQSLVAASRLGAINFHDGLLPRRAGVFAPEMAVAEGDEFVGATWHLIEADWDVGDIVHQTQFRLLPAESAESLHFRLLDAGCKGFDVCLERAMKGDLSRTPQDLSHRTYQSASDRPGNGLLCHSGTTLAELDRWFRSTGTGHGWGRLKCRSAGIWYEVLAIELPADFEADELVVPMHFKRLRRCVDGEIVEGMSAPLDDFTADECLQFEEWSRGRFRSAYFRERCRTESGIPEAVEPGSSLRGDLKTEEVARLLLATARRKNSHQVYATLACPAPADTPEGCDALLENATFFAWSFDPEATWDSLESSLAQALERAWARGPGFTTEAPVNLTVKLSRSDSWTLEGEVFEIPERPPAQRWVDCPRISPQEAAQSTEWGTGPVLAEGEDFLHRFWRHVSESPEKLAVETSEGAAWTYRELGRRVAGLIEVWRQEGRPLAGETVMVALPTSADLLVSHCALLTAGATIASIHPEESPSRLEAMVGLSQAKWGITGDRDGDGDGDGDGRTGDGFWSEFPRNLPTNAEGIIAPAVSAAGAFIIFTSGTTGAPKAVEITRANLNNHLEFIGFLSQWTGDSRAIITASPAFDGILEEQFITIFVGGVLVYPAPAAMQSMAMLQWELERRAITHFMCNTLIWSEWVRHEGFRIPETLKSVNAGGDRMGEEVLRRWLEAVNPGHPCLLLNSYGPTETTVTCTIHICSASSLTGMGVPIGKPQANAWIRLLDDDYSEVPPGEQGRIFVGGKGVTLGYRNNAELTAARFVETPWGRAYDTGDLGLWSATGELMFLGRADHQVKYRGFRLEMQEVEAALAGVPGCAFAIVHHFPAEGDAVDALIACLVSTSGPTSDQTQFLSTARAFIDSKLPRFLRPSDLVAVRELPLTSSGKPDRRALAELARERLNEIRSASLPASSPFEKALLEICRVLGVHRDSLNLERSFRDNGGDSLSAMAAHAAIERRLTRTFPLGILHGQRPLADLAAAFESTPTDDSAWIRVVSVPESHSGPVGERSSPPVPVIVSCHTIFGAPGLQNIWNEFEATNPILTTVFGERQKDWLRAYPDADLKAYALNFVAELRRMTAGAPAVFVGSSFGGWFAWTLATAFNEAGGEVRGVVLTEPYYWGPEVGVGADLALHYSRGQARVQRRLARLQRYPRWVKIRALLHRRLQLLALRGISRAPLWNYPPKPVNVEWNASHPHHKLISPLLTHQVPVVAPFDVLIFVRLDHWANFDGFRILVAPGGHLTFCRMAIREHHGFIYSEHGAFLAWKMRKSFGLSGGGSPRGS